MRYGYKVEGDKVYVTPIEYLCVDCGFCTTSQKEEAKHYYMSKHLSYTHLDPKKTEEWSEEKHGPLPDWVRA